MQPPLRSQPESASPPSLHRSRSFRTQGDGRLSVSNRNPQPYNRIRSSPPRVVVAGRRIAYARLRRKPVNVEQAAALGLRAKRNHKNQLPVQQRNRQHSGVSPLDRSTLEPAVKRTRRNRNFMQLSPSALHRTKGHRKRRCTPTPAPAGAGSGR